MKISIWQQHSSNNSVNYQVVGKFEGPRQAKAAKDFLSNMLDKIENWYIDNNIRIPSLGSNTLTPVEVYYQQRYDWSWLGGINWIPLRDEALVQIDGLLILFTPATIIEEPVKSVFHIIEHFNGTPYIVNKGKYKVIIQLELRTEQDAGKLFRMFNSEKVNTPNIQNFNASTTVERSRKQLTFTLQVLYGLANFIKYLRAYKPKHISYKIEPVIKS